MTNNEDIFIVDCWIDTESKENDLISLIKRLKEFDIPILLAGHYPVKPEIQNMVDYFLYDKDNPLLLRNEFREYDVASGRWSQMDNCKIENFVEFHHDYAIWTTMKNAFNFANYLGKKYIHFLEYDNLIDTYQYRQTFLEQSRNYDAILYEYRPNSVFGLDEYCATFIFTIKTDVGLNMINQIKDKEDYFTDKPGGWQLERVFLKCLKNVTNNFTISKYIANNNELNTQGVWNRDGMLRNGEAFQIYLAVDDQGKLYIHLISGFYEYSTKKDILVEVSYGNYKKFVTLKVDEFFVTEIGDYRKGDRVKVYHQGIEVFNEFLKDDYDKFREGNIITFNNPKSKPASPKAINVNFIDGAYINISDDEENKYHIEFIDTKTNKIEYYTDINNNSWAKTSKKYKTDWLIMATSNDFNFDHKLNLENQRIFISFESKSIGDSIAWIPYVEEFRTKNNCKVICSTFHNSLFKKIYPSIEFVEPGSIVYEIYAQYRIGVFYKDNSREEYDNYSHPTDPKMVPLQKIASDILGLDYHEIRPNIGKKNVQKKKQICISNHSTAQCKYWNNPNGWQDVVDFLIKNGYEVLLLSKEEDGYMGNKNPIGVKVIKPGSLERLVDIIEESELFIGISSGLSWLSWATGTPTIIISGFTDDYLEPQEGVTRMINKKVCHGCWGKYEFDPGDWNWCPEHKGTDRQFECTKQISSEEIIYNIDKILKINE